MKTFSTTSSILTLTSIWASIWWLYSECHSWCNLRNLLFSDQPRRLFMLVHVSCGNNMIDWMYIKNTFFSYQLIHTSKLVRCHYILFISICLDLKNQPKSHNNQNKKHVIFHQTMSQRLTWQVKYKGGSAIFHAEEWKRKFYLICVWLLTTLKLQTEA